MKTIHKKNTTFLNLAATALMVAALVLGCKQNVNNGGEVQPEKFTVTFNVNGGNGDLTATVDGKTITSPAQVEKGKNVAFTATPNKKYAVDKWSITPSNALIENGKAKDTTAKVKITENTTVNVTFKSTGVQPPTPPVTDGCTVTMSAGANGSITVNPVIPAGDKVSKDTEITFTATANPGYRVDTWTVTPAEALIADGQQGDATAKVKITENTTVNVTFKAIKYPVTMTHGEHGDITADMSIPAEGIDYGTEITFTATANLGYRVDTWTVTPAEALIADGQQGNTTAKVKVTANTTVNVTFKPIVYTPVAYADLHNHLTTAQPETNGIYYIEVTGLTAPDVKGNSISDSTSPLGQILNSNRQKKVALKFGTMPYVTDMSNCFNGCTSLVQVSNIPDSITNMWKCFEGCTNLKSVSNIPDGVTDMRDCFYGCTNLTSVPKIPDSVTNMHCFFKDCTSLTAVPNIPDSVTYMEKCFKGCISLTSVTLKCGYLDNKFDYAFDGCSRLSAGSIKVPADSLDDYKDNADKMKAKAEWFAKDE